MNGVLPGRQTNASAHIVHGFELIVKCNLSESFKHELRNGDSNGETREANWFS